MSDDRRVWEGAYQQRGQLWAGAIPVLPDLPPRARVLELGCGNGRLVTALLEKGWDTTALDFSATAVGTTRTSTRVFPGLHALCADARHLPFPVSVFDAVFAWHIIGHMDQAGRSRIAGQITSVLRPGGIVSFTEFTPRDFRFGKGFLSEEGTYVRGNGIRTHYFSGDEAVNLFAGLACISCHVHEWELKVRGKSHTRSEIQVIFSKDPEPG
jgi:SAM-dependent methyltransferase